MKTATRYFSFLAAGSMLLASILACSLPPIIVPTLVPTVPAARDIYVTTTGHDGPGCGPTTNPCLTVSMAVRRAQAGSTIHIGAGTFLEATTILLSKPLSFLGAGRTASLLSSRGPGMFEVAAAVDVHLQDLAINNITGASSNAISVDGGSSSLEMTRVNMQGNAGTALNIQPGSLVSVTDSMFAGSVTGISTGGVLQVTNNCVFQNNSMAIYTWGVTSIDRSTFTGNGAANMAAIRNDATRGIMSITNSTFSNNPDIAVINTEGARTNISGSTFNANGTGVDNDGGVVTIQTSLFMGLTSAIQVGVDVYTRDPARPGVDQISRTAILNMRQAVTTQGSNTTARLDNVTIGGSVAQALGIGGGNVTLSYSTIAYNAGDGADVLAGTLTVENSIIEQNGSGGSSNCSGLTPTYLGQNFACNPRLGAADLGLGSLTAAAGTQVYPLLAGSRAIDAAFGSCPTMDQRGYARPAGAHCDVGAYEFGSVMADTIATPGGPTVTPGIIQILPSETPTVALTGTPTAALIPTVTFIQNGNCRKGPGLAYNIVTSFATGAQVPALGRNDLNTWVYLPIPNTIAFCWVAIPSVKLNVPIEVLPLVPTPPLPDAPGKFNDKADCELKLKTLTVQLSWADVANASGYHLYRNGTLLASLDASVSTYLDKTAPLGHDLLYELESFNADGSSGRVQTTVSACK